MALDLCTKCVSPKRLPNKWLHFDKIFLVLLSKFKMHTKSECSGGVSSWLKLLLYYNLLLFSVKKKKKITKEKKIIPTLPIFIPPAFMPRGI